MASPKAVGRFYVDTKDRMVMDGVDERAAVHATCWRMAGKPDAWDAIRHLRRPRDLEPYQQQLFEFEPFLADGLGWMLVDPEADTPDGRRNRDRIAAILARGNQPGPDPDEELEL